MTFENLNLIEPILKALQEEGYSTPTPIQEKSIPILLQGKDLLGCAQTGTGKTAAYLLPVLNKLSEGGHPEDSINCIVMAPTRELAQQIDQQMEGFSYFMPVSSVAVYGGNDGVLFEQQKRGLRILVWDMWICPASPTSFWTKQTVCWIWGSMMTLCRL